MTQYTPGPWSIGGPYAYKTTLLNARGESIANGGNNRAVSGEVLEASLRLASAAPDLLEALQAIMAGVAGCQTEEPWASARAAIAKATGG